GQIEFVKVNTDAWRWRDVYRWLLGLTWPQFALFVASLYIGLNLLFAALYSFQQGSIAGSTGGRWFFDCFFFSVQTLATVGYGHMYPQTLYGHIVATIEIMSGIFLLAVMTGLIFVRFSRPIARVMFSNSMVIAPMNGKPTLMVRIGNENHHSMVEAEFRIMFSRDERLIEGDDFRHFYVLKLHFDRLTVFPAALTLRHTIDETSPLFGATPESLESGRVLFIVSVVGIDPVIAAAVQTQKDYSWRDIQFGHRFVEIYTEHGGGRLTVDYGRLHDTEQAEFIVRGNGYDESSTDRGSEKSRLA
ncbi:MAG: ATP-sensitive inward rectifier potassium channel 10, partial [Verrucomicrobia bacterium]|nr:ATP-sensitive inward rectifier potassium channel 10 [Verrucomicrobiota bacterium]